MRHFGRALWQRLGLVLAGLFLGLLAAEGLARVLRPPGSAHLVFNAADAEPPGLWRIDRRLGLELVPGFEGTYAIPGRRVDLRVNSHGMRGPEPEHPARGLLVLGDSFTLALQVSEEQHFLTRLSRELGVSVHNGGVSGDCTWQSAMRWQRWSPTLQPDAVLLVYFAGNDLVDNAAFERWRIDGPLEPGPQPIMEVEPPPPWHLRLLRERSFLWARWRVHRQLRSVQAGGDQPLRVSGWKRELEAFGADGEAAIQRALPANREALRWLSELCEAAGQRLVVAVAPPALAVEHERLGPTFALAGLSSEGAEPHAPGAAIMALLDELEIPSCDLHQPLADAHAQGVDSYLVFDGHWSVEGHAVVADALAACLVEVTP